MKQVKFNISDKVWKMLTTEQQIALLWENDTMLFVQCCNDIAYLRAEYGFVVPREIDENDFYKTIAYIVVESEDSKMANDSNADFVANCKALLNDSEFWHEYKERKTEYDAYYAYAKQRIEKIESDIRGGDFDNEDWVCITDTVPDTSVEKQQEFATFQQQLLNEVKHIYAALKLDEKKRKLTSQTDSEENQLPTAQGSRDSDDLPF
ncbi:MAG: hypothetical protein MJ198_05010 [Bacteroidales bacterium]|nr:hypothetical protein [Bacteroidales bacterium]